RRELPQVFPAAATRKRCLNSSATRPPNNAKRCAPSSVKAAVEGLAVAEAAEIAVAAAGEAVAVVEAGTDRPLGNLTARLNQTRVGLIQYLR
ncbi:MAG: hypothetical protein O3A46_11325, partial [Candidatus Poribacteria bacterium]|nr:hypothetical protein [Candidatus Poribacteria bacterium]